MSGKLSSANGKVVEMTITREEMTAHLLEAFDQLRAGIIDADTALALATMGRTVIANEVAGLMAAKQVGGKPESKYFGLNKTKQLT